MCSINSSFLFNAVRIFTCEGLFGYFQFWASTKLLCYLSCIGFCVNINVHLSGINAMGLFAGLYNKCIFTSQNKLSNYFPKWLKILHYHQQCMRNPVSPRQQLVSNYLKRFSCPNKCTVVSHCDLNSPFPNG